VVCDRFAASTLAYQGYGRGLDLDLVRQVNNYAVGDCWPDLTIILDVPLEVARQRRQHRANRPDRLEREGDLLQERVCRAYREIAHKEAGAVLLDARLGIEEVAEQVRRKLHSRWPGYPFGPKRGEE
jgi:dTMP kinase